MSAPRPRDIHLADPDPDETPRAWRARYRRELEALATLATLGMTMARNIGAELQVQADAVVSGRSPPDAAADRLAIGF
jgi:hypothetical protein